MIYHVHTDLGTGNSKIFVYIFSYINYQTVTFLTMKVRKEIKLSQGLGL